MIRHIAVTFFHREASIANTKNAAKAENDKLNTLYILRIMILTVSKLRCALFGDINFSIIRSIPIIIILIALYGSDVAKSDKLPKTYDLEKELRLFNNPIKLRSNPSHIKYNVIADIRSGKMVQIAALLYFLSEINNTKNAAGYPLNDIANDKQRSPPISKRVDCVTTKIIIKKPIHISIFPRSKANKTGYEIRHPNTSKTQSFIFREAESILFCINCFRRSPTLNTSNTIDIKK